MTKARIPVHRHAITTVATIASLTCSAAALGQGGLFPAERDLAGKKPGEIALKAGTHEGNPADWGVILVPENRAKPESRVIKLYLLRQKALEKADRPPIFYLVGGPGNGNVWGIDIQPFFFTHNDVVRVGYRGIDSSTQLKCPEVGDAFVVDRPLSSESLSGVRDALRKAHDRLSKDGLDIDGYSILEVVDDIEAVRKALGYEQIDIFATSYGSLVTWVYAQRHPRSLRRAMMIGAGNIARHIVWDPATVDRQLRQYGDLWRQDPEATAKTPDILATIKGVLATLPRKWRHITIDPDKVRVALFHMLYETQSAALALDAFVAAEKDDYSGLAVMSDGYDKDIRGNRGYWCEFFAKALSAGLDPSADYEAAMDPPGSVIGSPLSRLLWGAASGGGWPMKPIPAEYLTLRETKVRILAVNGGLDVSGPPEYALELQPFLPNGRVVILPNMGHMDPARLQRDAFRHMTERFFGEGEIDTSKYHPQTTDFTPEQTLQDYAKELFGPKDGG